MTVIISAKENPLAKQKGRIELICFLVKEIEKVLLRHRIRFGKVHFFYLLVVMISFS